MVVCLPTTDGSPTSVRRAAPVRVAIVRRAESFQHRTPVGGR